MKTVDNQGRIVIPKHLRIKYNLDKGAKIDFIESFDGIKLIIWDPFCKICKRQLQSSLCENTLCNECKNKFIKEY